jgi:hypothetical protein
MENIPIDPIPIDDSFHSEQLASIKVASPLFYHYANFVVEKVMPP